MVSVRVRVSVWARVRVSCGTVALMVLVLFY